MLALTSRGHDHRPFARRRRPPHPRRQAGHVGKWFNAIQYGVRPEDHLIDFDQVERSPASTGRG
jgi:hypothetical protein